MREDLREYIGWAVGVASLLAFAWWAIRSGAHRAYVAGDAAEVERLLSRVDSNSRIALSVALGRYGDALRLAKDHDQRTLDPACNPPIQCWLERINACEALVELGRAKDAVELLTPDPAAVALLRSGRGTALAWTLTCLGEHKRALEALRTVTPEDLGPEYCAEAYLTQTLILLNLGRVDDAGKALDECRRVTMRASTERNVLLLEARRQVMAGRIEDGLKTFTAARDHRWKCQGGSSLLALGDALRDAGRIEEARTCWSLAIERDAESHWAAQAKERLQPA